MVCKWNVKGLGNINIYTTSQHNDWVNVSVDELYHAIKNNGIYMIHTFISALIITDDKPSKL